MNIFFIGMTPEEIAKYHCDAHVVKMILETVQLLCTACYYICPNEQFVKKLYKKTHYNHPCAVWARTSYGNFKYLWLIGMNLCLEYTHRYKKTHKCEQIFDLLKANIKIIKKSFNESIEFTLPPLCMPDIYKQETKDMNDVIESYRAFYKSKEETMKKEMVWKTQEPSWFRE
jgi:hypothetical protein